jgi:hypothetical protein
MHCHECKALQACNGKPPPEYIRLASRILWKQALSSSSAPLDASLPFGALSVTSDSYGLPGSTSNSSARSTAYSSMAHTCTEASGSNGLSTCHMEMGCGSVSEYSTQHVPFWMSRESLCNLNSGWDALPEHRQHIFREKAVATRCAVLVSQSCQLFQN